MYNKEIFSLITDSNNPISVSSTNGTEVFGPVRHNENARSGRIYLSANGFNVPTVGLAMNLYASFNGHSWFLQSAFPTVATAYNKVIELAYVPRYMKFGYALDGQGLGVLRAIIEADSEY